MSLTIKSIRKRLRIFKKFYFWIFDVIYPKLEIDQVLLKKTVAQFHLDDVTRQLKEEYNNHAFGEGENAGYFKNILTYIDADKHFPENPLFIYPPNAAVIDFLVKNIDKKTSILEYACGPGNLLIYFRRIGFRASFGYDNYSQIKKETVLGILEGFDLGDVVLSKSEALSLPAKVALCVCFFWSRLDRDIILKEANNPELEFILIDYQYAPRFIKNFKIVGIYKNLLIVFKRK